jgi:hypothetical protein
VFPEKVHRKMPIAPVAKRAPPPNGLELFEKTESLMVSGTPVPAKIAPPFWVVLPFSKVNPVIFVAAVILKMRLALFPLMARLAAPGPLIVRNFVIAICPVVSVMVCPFRAGSN